MKSTEELDKINKKILSQFKDKVEWKEYEDKLYPFWLSDLKHHFGDWTFTEWSSHMLSLLQDKNEVPKVKPTFDFETDSKTIVLEFNETKTKDKF